MQEDNSKEKNSGLEEEEKKESSPGRVVPRTTALEDLQESLPSELKGKVYNDEGELWEAQAKIGLSDLQIVLNNEGYAVWRDMPDPPHIAAVRAIHAGFLNWKEDQVAVLFGEKEADVFVSESCERNKKRFADFAIWGPDRLDESGFTRGKPGKFMNPHVIFKFSWGTKIEKEKAAVDDMSKYAGQDDLESLGRPNVLYVIKAKRKGDPNPQPDSPVHGFDVYEVRQGGELTIDHPTLASRVGGNEHVTIEVAPGDMGLRQGADAFLISLSDIRAKMEKIYVAFEAENQDE